MKNVFRRPISRRASTSGVKPRGAAIKRWLPVLLSFVMPASAQEVFFSDGFEEGAEPVTLAISLVPSSAVPPDEVEVVGIPDNVDAAPLYADITTQEGTRYKALLDERDDGSVVMVTPLHADSPTDGGPVSVQVTNGDNVTSNAAPFDIQPLPPATVTIQDVVTKLQVLADLRLTLNGRTREQLRALAGSEMTAIDFPLFMAQHILDSPDNDNSLRASVDGPVPFFDNATFDFDLANRLLSRTGIDGFLDQEIASLDGMTLGSTIDTSPWRGAALTADAYGVAATTSGCIDQGTLGIDTAPELDNAMSVAQFSVRRLDGASGKVVRDLSGGFTALGVIPLPVAKSTSHVMGGVIYVYKLLNEASSSLLPTDFNNGATTYTANPAKLNEDALLGFWNEFKVTAVSEGWDVDADVLKAIFKLAKFKDLGGIKLFDDKVPSEFAQRAKNYLFSEAIKFVIDDATQGGSYLQICPGTWPDIDATLPPYSKPSIPSGTSITLGEEHNAYEPKEIGISQLKVETGPDRFGGRLAFETGPIEVKQIQVSVSPDRYAAETSEILTFEAVVNNADDDRVKWTVPAPFAVVENLGNVIVIQAPDEPWETVILKARSISNWGLREGKIDSDPRDGVATIEHKEGGVKVSPPFACVAPNESQSFTAEVLGVENQEVDWSLEGPGLMIGNEYTAPSTAGGEATVIANSVEVPSLTGAARVLVGECQCAWVASVSGDLSAAWSGSWAVWSQGQGGPSTVQFFPSDSETLPSITGTLVGSIQPGATGNFDFLSLQIFDGTPEGSYIGPLADNPPPRLIILANDGVSIEGSITGILGAGTIAEPRLVNLTMSFIAAELMSNGGSPCSAQ